MKSKRMLLFMSFVLSAMFFTGCTHLSSVSTSSIPKNRDKVVRAEASRFVFLLFNFDNDYADDVVVDLARECPNGKVKGILTKHESIVYFPLIAHKYRITAEGYCVKK